MNRERRSWFRVSLKTILILMAIIAAYLAGRWNGYQQAYKEFWGGTLPTTFFGPGPEEKSEPTH